MKKKHIFFGMLVSMLALSLLVIGCKHDSDDDDGGGGGGGSIPTELVGKWGDVGAGLSLLEIKADKSGTYYTTPVTWSVSGNTLTLSTTGQSGSAKYSVSSDGKKLTLSDATGDLASLWTVLITIVTTIGPLEKQQ